ncbi:hypothetical protein CDD81_5911 [Ophiocordyceps australis]|uniref:Uncharacterized protein n=1 Tax=Ophiocordyceps australis TaxID=1399860 RepID=A0A2C5XC23_9HYPO|nr:hypothetical protein CDD81_5911 [Ophiocordyceps australis]
MASQPSTAAVLQGMAAAMPTHPCNDDSSDLASSYEAVALLVHAYLTARGFVLVSLDQDKLHEECTSLAPRLPPSWNSRFGTYTFVYILAPWLDRLVVRVDRIGSRVEVRALVHGLDRISRLESAVRDIVAANGLPLRIPISDAQEDRGAALLDRLGGLFTSEAVVTSFLQSLDQAIVQPILPQLARQDADASQGDATARAERLASEASHLNLPPRSTIPPPSTVDDAPPRARPTADFAPPDFEDEHQMLPRPATLPDGTSPFSIGADDLNPPGLGPLDPLRPCFTPGPSQGMQPSFDHPLFAGRGRRVQDPQHPFGARYDPVGPGDDSLWGGSSGRAFGPRGQGPFGRGGHPFGGDGDGPFGGGGGGPFGGGGDGII